MATVKLRNVNPVVFNYNVGLGDTNPTDKLVINNGSLRLDHPNGGHGLHFKSSSAAGNDTSIRFSNSLGTERFKIHHDAGANGTDDLRIISNNNATTCVTILQNGNMGLGATVAPMEKLDVNDGNIRLQPTYALRWMDDDQTFRSSVEGNATNIEFYTAGNSSTPQATLVDGGFDKLKVTSDGSDDEGASIVLKHANNNTADVISTLSFSNNEGSVAKIQGGTSGGNTKGYIDFLTSNAGSNTSRMMIHPDGRIGIGTSASTPTATLHVKDTDSDVLHIEASNGVVLKIKSNGRISFDNLPSSNSGLSVGEIYRSGTNIQIVTS